MQRLIDAHHHLWQLPGAIHYPWLEDNIDNSFFLGDYQSIRQSFTTADLERLIPNGYELVASVHCEAECSRNQAINEARWIDNIRQQGNIAKAQVVWVDLLADDVTNQLAEMAKIPSVRGVRFKPKTATNPQQIASLEKSCSLADSRWQSGLDALQQYNLSWDLRVPSWHLLEAAELIANFPNLTVVLNHCGLPWDRSQNGLKDWQSGLQSLAKHPNCWVKLSELACPNRSYDFSENQALLNKVLATFGTEKSMFASNMPVAGIQVSYAKWLTMVETAITEIEPTAKDAVLWQNAANCYRIFD